MENTAQLLTQEMAETAHAMISQVHIPAGQAAQALLLLSAIAAIAKGETKVVYASNSAERKN